MMPSCFKEIHRVARKQHKCCECKGVINPRDTYQYISGVWDGEPSSFKTCTPCTEARAFYEDNFAEFREPEDGTSSIGDLRSDLEYAASDLISCNSGLRIKTLRLVVEMNQRRDAAVTKGGTS